MRMKLPLLCAAVCCTPCSRSPQQQLAVRGLRPSSEHSLCRPIVPPQIQRRTTPAGLAGRRAGIVDVGESAVQRPSRWLSAVQHRGEPGADKACLEALGTFNTAKR
ncbi:hypothetical protein PHYSODRAFT_304662 [Phytophthora sojae]|uniref:Uncharacterized protein n=1 Tax=Phytophthora sojae (strain P6497) TaxID=1094619 RepID=G5A221_PHYSP|nr:hypothetical protein PHYSODRAFT_304662 [Phytophthora sojae]EGZ10969.1 hypothetical protein PHYSODRAFT_304662 [Phytophthora sojae]|eukprot:XP_009533714.1 hypothetical protein PHYSODRAFT_304662 [Phytophthora sojae]